MDRQTAIAAIKRLEPVLNYLDRAPHGGYTCPFCGSGTGRNQSGAVKIYQDTNTGYCFACDRSFDVIDLYGQVNKSDFNNSIFELSKKMGIEINSKPQNAPQAPQSRGKAPKDKTPIKDYKTAPRGVQSTTEANRESDYTEYFKVCRERLETSPEAIAYLNGRGIGLATATACGVGYDPEADTASNPGALTNRGKIHTAQRIIIPTSKSHYVARRIDGVKDFAKLNPKGGTPGIFNGAALYGPAQNIIILEGAFDAMSIIEAGGQAIALNSANNGGKLIEQLKERPATGKAFIIAFDSDSDPKTRERIRTAAEDLRQSLEGLGYKALINWTIAGEYKDANERLIDDLAGLIEAVQEAEKEAEQPLFNGDKEETDTPRADQLAAFYAAIQGEQYKPIETGLKCFDNALGGGVMNGTICTIVAAPGIGKTTLCMQLAEMMAEKQRPVIYINLEMSRDQMLAKAFSYHLLMDQGQRMTAQEVLQGYKWTDDQRQAIKEAMHAYRGKIWPYLRYNPAAIGSDLDKIINYITETAERARTAGKDAPAVFIDYLHLITSPNSQDKQELIKKAITALKQYAIAFNTFCIVVAAKNRNSDNYKITLESGRDSSAIEYGGDYQIGLNYYESQYNGKSPEAAKEASGVYRHLCMPNLKGRWSDTFSKNPCYFYSRYNTFYDVDNFMPADPDFVPFVERKKREKEENEKGLKLHF